MKIARRGNGGFAFSWPDKQYEVDWLLRLYPNSTNVQWRQVSQKGTMITHRLLPGAAPAGVGAMANPIQEGTHAHFCHTPLLRLPICKENHSRPN
jgi:hypothetical protein